MSAPSRATRAGRAYLDLRKLARESQRPVDELLHLYVLEAFLDRLASSRFAEQLVLKGGVLLAAFGERRATRDVDLQAQAVESDVDVVLGMACEIAAMAIDDGVVFEIEMVTAEQIRDEEIYAGVRVTMTARLASARQHFHIDMNAGDPITPAPKQVRLPRLLGGEVLLRGYPLAMMHAEKIVTAVARGTVNTRWRDFADIYMLARRHAIDGGRARPISPSSLRAPASAARPALDSACRLWADRPAEMGSVVPQAAARGPAARAVRRRRRSGPRLRRSSDSRGRRRSFLGSSRRCLVGVMN